MGMHVPCILIFHSWILQQPRQNLHLIFYDCDMNICKIMAIILLCKINVGFKNIQFLSSFWCARVCVCAVHFTVFLLFSVWAGKASDRNILLSLKDKKAHFFMKRKKINAKNYNKGPFCFSASPLMEVLLLCK